MIDRVFVLFVRVLRGLEAARDVETQIDVVRAAAARELPERRAERVREIQLQRVAARALFNRDAPLRRGSGRSRAGAACTRR